MKNKKKIGFGAAVILALTLLTPAQAAHAIDSVNCDGRRDFLQISVDYSPDFTACFANRGVYDRINWWAYKIRSGNNDIRWKADGQWHYLPRWHVLTFPNVWTVRLQAVEIL